MKRNKKQSSKQFYIKLKSSTKFVILLILFVSTSTFISCESNCESIENNDEFYVKYVVNSRTIYIVNRKARIKSNDNSNLEFTFRDPNWEKTIGPVSKNFRATLDVNYETSQTLAQTYVDVEIYVSKNNGPFALKANDSSPNPRMSASTNYTIE